MKLLVKTLKGSKFPIEADDGSTIAAVKGIIEATNAEMPAANMKLIHSGKVLKDDDVLSSIGVKENDFLVVMVTKPKKAAPAAPKTPTPKPEESKKDEASKAEPPAATSTTAETPAAASAIAVTTTPAPSTTTTATPAAPTQPNISDAAVENLTGMGFPEEAVRHCLRVAQGNPDLAVEFLTNGIPEGAEQAMQAAAARQTATPAASSTGGGSSGSNSSSAGNQPLQALRNHPQFNQLRQLVQTNPQMLQQVLAQIGQQSPELLQEINANQALFLQMMNEPIQEGSSGSGAAASSTSSSTTARTSSASASGDNPFSAGMGNPMQMAQMIQSMGTEELNQMAQAMGLSPDQLRATAQMIGQMPPEQLNQYLMQAMGEGGMEGMFGGGGGGPGGPQVLRLTDDEMAAVDRLTEMGFDRAEAAQAFLACDKNEDMAANFLMDSMMGDDAGNQGGGGNGGSSGGGGGGNSNDDDDEDMYD